MSEPKFKVGDRVKHRFDMTDEGDVVAIDGDSDYPIRVRWNSDGLMWHPEGNLYLVSPQTIVEDPETGGKKGAKAEEYALIPPGALAEVARVYGMGSRKYEPFNWALGYRWSLSYSALFRHIEAHRSGQSTDPESGYSHLAHAAFHLFTLMEFEKHGLGTDDRWTPTNGVSREEKP